MAVVFPTTPAPNQVVTDPVTNATWRWDAPSQRWVPAATGASFVPIPGGTMTGPLILSGDATTALQPVSFQQLQAAIGAPTYVGTTPPSPPNNSGDLWMDTSQTPPVLMVYDGSGWVVSIAPPTGFLPLTGGTISGSLSVAGNFWAGAASVAGGIWAQSLTTTADISCAGLLYVPGVVYTQLNPSSYWGFWYNTANTTAYTRINGVTDIAIGTASDERLKEAIEPTGFDGLKAVLATPLFQYRFKGEGGEERPIGFIAQRMLGHFPQAVAGQDALTMSMDKDVLLAAAYDAIKQLSDRVQALEAKT